MNTTIVDFSTDKISRHRAVLLGLCVGDSLGSTSEFERPTHVGEKCKNGWPACQVGNRMWQPGQPTDDTDMMIKILKSYQKLGYFEPYDIMLNFIDCPFDIGFTTRSALGQTKQKIMKDDSEEAKKTIWYEASQQDFLKNRKSAANGSLMRNGIIPVITEDMPIDTAIEYTILQGISTHYNPLATLTCVLQTIIIRRALLDASSRNGAPQIPPPTMNDIRSMIDNEWHTWLSRVTEPACLEWIRTVGKTEIKMAEVQLLEELNGFETFDPYGYMYKGVSGYSVLSLKIALWALHWSVKREKVLVAPDHLPTWPFDNQPSGFDSIMFVVLIGADADTYGAIAGPMLAAYHPFIKESFMDKLWERNTVESIQF